MSVLELTKKKQREDHFEIHKKYLIISSYHSLFFVVFVTAKKTLHSFKKGTLLYLNCNIFFSARLTFYFELNNSIAVI
jgi:hypothetical protein